MLNADRLFQALLEEIMGRLGEPEESVGADLDVDSFEAIPFVTHRSLVAQDRNGDGLYTVTLTISLFVDVAETPFEWIERFYVEVQRWGSVEMTGIVPGVGGVHSIDREIAAFERLASGVQMLNKSVTQYVGSWQLTVRK